MTWRNLHSELHRTYTFDLDGTNTLSCMGFIPLGSDATYTLGCIGPTFLRPDGI